VTELHDAPPLLTVNVVKLVERDEVPTLYDMGDMLEALRVYP
jgi:hypothetical protein